jgi:transcriptional regulator of acetoin/glycerol metabolism
MSKRSSAHLSTLDHHGPIPPAHEAHASALIVVFPREVALPMPAVFAPVGRHWFASKGIDDRKVSSRHLQVSIAGGRAHVADAGSRNGTWIDGRRLAEGETVPLEDGAVLRVGSMLMVFRARFGGNADPAEPMGELVAPFGLQELSNELTALARLGAKNVLIEGDTGTGKELLAREVAARLGRQRPYCAINVAAVPAGLFESQLFGHVAGAFSDARTPASGVIVANDGGTVFLDEIGELPLELQPKLLRLLESRELMPVGADRPLRANVLLVAATNRDLEELVQRGSFRRDLFARLALARVFLPPLRERREDILAIARALAPRCGISLDPATTEVEAIERLLLDPWPNNVRGLLAALTRVAAVDPQPGLRLWAVERALESRARSPESTPVESDSLRQALAEANGNESEAARRLGISRGKLRRLLGKT